jgi:hypothetical protein
MDEKSLWWQEITHNTGYNPVVVGLAFMLARAVIRAVLPPGTYFRFMDRVLKRYNGNGDNTEK